MQKFAAFDYEVHHRPGKTIGHTDGLSRIPVAKIQTVEPERGTRTHQRENETSQEEYKWPNEYSGHQADCALRDPLAVPQQVLDEINGLSTNSHHVDIRKFEYHEKAWQHFHFY